MGLLDGFLGKDWNDPQSSAVLALAGGLLSGNFGQGAKDYGNILAGAKDTEMKRKLIDMQMQNMQSEIDQRKIAQGLAAQKQDTLSKLFGGGTSPGAFVPSADGMGPTMPPSMQQASGIGALDINKIAQLKAQYGIDLMEPFKWANDPLQMQPGSVVKDRLTGKERVIPKIREGVAADSNGFYSPLPGYADAEASIEGKKAGAVERAKSAYDFVEVPMSDGTKKMMSREAAQQALGGSTQPGQPSAPVSLRNSGDASVTPELLAAVEADAASRGGPAPTLIMNGKGKTFGWQPDKKQASGMLGQTQTPQDAAALKTSTEAAGKINDAWFRTSHEPVIAAGQAAQSLIDNTTVARNALKSLGNTGWRTEAKAAGASVLSGMGIAPKTAEMFAANAQIFQGKAMDRLWTTLNTAKGPQTEGDANRASQTWAQLKNTPQANEFILDMAQAQAERDKAKATFYSNALPIAQKSGDMSEIDRQWSKRMPSIFEMPTMQKWNKK